MSASENYLQPEVVQQLQGLQLRARSIVEGYVSGVHKSPFHGFSVEFAQHREYVPGDDLRYVDWKVFGRTDKVYLKQFEEETNLICYLLVDTSESMLYQSDEAPVSKFQYAQLVAASLAYLILSQQDSVGLATLRDAVGSVTPPSGNPAHLSRITYQLEQDQPAGSTKLGDVIESLLDRMTRRGIVVLISDLFDDFDRWMRALKHLRHRRHDVVVMQILDPAEVDFPFKGTTKFVGLEGLGDITTDPTWLRKAYQREFGAFLKQVEHQCRDHGLDYVQMQTHQSLAVALSSYLSRRMTHSAGAARK